MFGDGVLSELPLLIFLKGGKVGKGTHGYFYPQVVDTILRFSFWFKGWDLPLPMSLRGTWTSRLGSESSPAHVELKGCGKIDHFFGILPGGGALGTEDMCTSCYGGRIME